jgi:hypothetical protein
MKRTWTIIGVKDVPGLRVVPSLLASVRRPAHPYFGQLLDLDGTVLLCLHEWGVSHPR